MRYSRAVTDHNDWRVTISLTDPGQVRRAKHAISLSQVEENVHRRHAAVRAEHSGVFLPFIPF